MGDIRAVLLEALSELEREGRPLDGFSAAPRTPDRE